MTAGGPSRRAQMQQALEQFADATTQGDAVAEYQVKAQRRAWQKVTRSFDDEFSSRLRVELPSLTYLDAAHAGDAAAAIQRAVATYGAYMAKREHVQRLSGADIERVHLVQIRQDRNVIWLGLPARPRDELPIAGQRSADVALRELLEHLPKDAGEEQHVINGVLGARQPIRKAVDEIAAVGAGQGSPVSLSLLDGSGMETRSYLTLDAARSLHSMLTVSTASTKQEDVHGTVDGLRTSRSTLYLVRDNGREISVHIEEHQRQQVIDLIRHKVVAKVHARVLQSAAGAQSRKAYRLVSISGVDEGFL